MIKEEVSLLEGPLAASAQKLEPGLLTKLDALYAFYHKQWWCYTYMYRVFKCRHALLNGMILLILATGMVVGSVYEKTVVVTVITAVGTLVKGWMEFKKLSVKIDMSRFAYTTYAKTLTELRNYVRGIPFDEEAFLIKMNTFEDTITDFTPLVNEKCMVDYDTRFQYSPLIDTRDFVNGI